MWESDPIHVYHGQTIPFEKKKSASSRGGKCQIKKKIGVVFCKSGKDRNGVEEWMRLWKQRGRQDET